MTAPIFTIPTRGFLIPMIFSIYTEPILANCTRWEGLASTLAPQSTRSATPFSVGINGAEEEKGNALVKETYPLLKNCPEINFIGSVEARDIPAGVADVIVCEAFVGNVILKLYEGVGATMLRKVKAGMMTSLRSKIGALLVKPALKKTLKAFDLQEYGGAPMLGLNGLVVKTHGSSKAVEIKNSVLQCVTFKEQKINDKKQAQGLKM